MCVYNLWLISQCISCCSSFFIFHANYNIKYQKYSRTNIHLHHFSLFIFLLIIEHLNFKFAITAESRLNNQKYQKKNFWNWKMLWNELKSNCTCRDRNEFCCTRLNSKDIYLNFFSLNFLTLTHWNFWDMDFVAFVNQAISVGSLKFF